MIDIYFQFFFITIFILMLLVLSYYLTKIKILNKEIKDSENIIQRIINELKERLYSQDQKILDLDVKLNIIDLKINKFSYKINDKVINKPGSIFNNRPLEKIVLQKKLILTETEKKILDNLSDKECTVNDLQPLLGKTREHTSRLLNKLFSEGYITRDDLKKPYQYKLLNKNNTIFE